MEIFLLMLRKKARVVRLFTNGIEKNNQENMMAGHRRWKRGVAKDIKTQHTANSKNDNVLTEETSWKGKMVYKIR